VIKKKKKVYKDSESE